MKLRKLLLLPKVLQTAWNSRHRISLNLSNARANICSSCSEVSLVSSVKTCLVINVYSSSWLEHSGWCKDDQAYQRCFKWGCMLSPWIATPPRDTNNSFYYNRAAFLLSILSFNPPLFRRKVLILSILWQHWTRMSINRFPPLHSFPLTLARLAASSIKSMLLWLLCVTVSHNCAFLKLREFIIFSSLWAYVAPTPENGWARWYGDQEGSCNEVRQRLLLLWESFLTWTRF